MWNATKFILGQLEPHSFTPFQFPFPLTSPNLDLADKWILSRLSWLVKQMNHGFETLNFSSPALSFYEFFLLDFCDYYLEYSKLILYLKIRVPPELLSIRTEMIRSILFTCLEISLRLVHPLMPFLSEVKKPSFPLEITLKKKKELWQSLPFKENTQQSESIMIASYPEFSEVQNWSDAESEKKFQVTS